MQAAVDPLVSCATANPEITKDTAINALRHWKVGSWATAELRAIIRGERVHVVLRTATCGRKLWLAGLGKSL